MATAYRMRSRDTSNRDSIDTLAGHAENISRLPYDGLAAADVLQNHRDTRVTEHEAQDAECGDLFSKQPRPG